MKTPVLSITVIAVLAAVLVVMAGSSGVARADPGPVLAGYDLLETDSSETWLGFGQPNPDPYPDSPVLPGSMFGPGCDDFADIVFFKGVPFDSFDPDGPGGQPAFTGLQSTDTIVQRLQDAGPTFPDTIDIEIVRLELVSVAPITIFNCTGGNQQWEIKAQVPEGDANQNPGTMTIDHDDPADTYWRFDAEFPIDPIMTFTRVGGGLGSPIGPNYLSAFGLPVFVLSTIEPGDTQPEEWCQSQALVLQIPGLTSNFVPGVDCQTGVITGVGEGHLPPWTGKHAVRPVAGPVGGTTELLVGGSDAPSAAAGSGSSGWLYAAIAAAAAAVAMSVAGGWYARRRWMR